MATKPQSKPDEALYFTVLLVTIMVCLTFMNTFGPKTEYKVSIMSNKIIATTNSRTGKVTTYNLKLKKDGMKLVEIK